MSTETVRATSQRRTPWAAVPFPGAVIAYVAVRLTVLAAVAIGNLSTHHGLVADLSTWDGAWFLRAVEHGWPSVLPTSHGHVMANPIAFFPLFPLTVRALAFVTKLSGAVVGLVVSGLSGLGAVIAVGVLARRVTDGAIWLGPNAVLAFAREGYGRLTTNPRDLVAALSHRGFRRLAKRHWRAGAAEMWGDISKRAFLRACQAFIPELGPADLQPGPSGVRAQALGPEGVLLDDFCFEEPGGRVIHVRNAPSPGATSSLAIARMIADRVDAVAE